MSISAQRQQVQGTMFRQSGGAHLAHARQLTQPVTSPGSVRDDRRSVELARRKKREAAHAVVVQYSIGVALVAGVMGAILLGGHVELARQAQRSVIVNEMLCQQVERARLLGNAQARDVTPTSISQRADRIGMVHPDERDTIVMP
jgi:hypothetical protein